MQQKFNTNLNLNISRIRRKNKNNFIKNTIKLFLLFLIVLFGFFYIWYCIIRPKLIEKNLINFPLYANSDVNVCLEKAGKGFCLLTKNDFSFYDKDGSKLKHVYCNLDHPVINCCSNFTLIYDQNGKFCSLNYFENNLCNVFLDEGNILLAKVYSNGNFALVTGDESSFCQLNAFNKNGEKIFKWNSAENLIIDFEFNNNGSGCYVCVLGVDENGLEKAIIYCFNFNKNKEVAKKIINEVMPIALKITNSGFCLVCDNAFYLFDYNCSMLKNLQFSEKWNTFNFSYKSYFIFDFNSNLMIYDKYINLLGKINLNGVIKKIKLIGKYIFTLVDEKLYIFNLRLKLIKTIELGKLASDFFCDGRYGYFLFDNRVEKFKIF